jgi:hypothetical protein
MCPSDHVPVQRMNVSQQRALKENTAYVLLPRLPLARAAQDVRACMYSCVYWKHGSCEFACVRGYDQCVSTRVHMCACGGYACVCLCRHAHAQLRVERRAAVPWLPCHRASATTSHPHTPPYIQAQARSHKHMLAQARGASMCIPRSRERTWAHSALPACSEPSVLQPRLCILPPLCGCSSAAPRGCAPWRLAVEVRVLNTVLVAKAPKSAGAFALPHLGSLHPV